MRNQTINRNFKNIRTGSLIIILAACFVYACGSSGPDPSETEPPSITLYSPDSNGILMNGDTIQFSGHISDNLKLKSMLLTIEGMQHQIYYTYNPNVQDMAYFSFNTPWLVYGIPYDTTGYLNLLVTDINDNYAYKHWYMRLRN